MQERANTQQQQEDRTSEWCTNIIVHRLEGRIRKRRAERACQKCHSRKVRCDLVFVGSPCNNCRLDGAHCKPVDSKRKSRLRPNEIPNGGTELVQGGRGSAESALEDESSTSHTPAQVLGLVTTNPPNEDSNPSTCQPELLKTTKAGQINDLSKEMPSVKSNACSADARNIQFRLPSIRLGKIDLWYTRAKGAMDLYCTNLRSSLFEAYVEFVFPILPIVDLQNIEAVLAEDQVRSKPIGLSLLQSIFLLGSLYVQSNSLKEHGFLSRTTAMRTIYRRVKLLSDMEYDSDPLEAFQVALHLVHYFEELNQHAIKHKWLLKAMVIAKRLHLEDESDETVSHRISITPLDRRLKWALCAILTTSSIRLLGNTIVQFEHSTMPAVEEGDFGISSLSTLCREILLGDSLNPETEIEGEFATLCASITSLRSLMPRIYGYDRIILERKADEQCESIPIKHIGASYLQAEKLLHEWALTLPQDFQSAWSHNCPTRLSRGSLILKVRKAYTLSIYFNLCKELENRMIKLMAIANTSLHRRLLHQLKHLRDQMEPIETGLVAEVLRTQCPSQLYCAECRVIFKTLVISQTIYSRQDRLDTTLIYADSEFAGTCSTPSPPVTDKAPIWEATSWSPCAALQGTNEVMQVIATTPVSTISSVFDNPENVRDDEHCTYSHILIPEGSVTSDSDIEQYVDFDMCLDRNLAEFVEMG